MTQQSLIAAQAFCQDCDASCEARNALAWAHNHARHHGHKVVVDLAYTVRPQSSKVDGAADG